MLPVAWLFLGGLAGYAIANRRTSTARVGQTARQQHPQVPRDPRLPPHCPTPNDWPPVYYDCPPGHDWNTCYIGCFAIEPP